MGMLTHTGWSWARPRPRRFRRRLAPRHRSRPCTGWTSISAGRVIRYHPGFIEGHCERSIIIGCTPRPGRHQDSTRAVRGVTARAARLRRLPRAGPPAPRAPAGRGARGAPRSGAGRPAAAASRCALPAQYSAHWCSGSSASMPSTICGSASFDFYLGLGSG